MTFARAQQKGAAPFHLAIVRPQQGVKAEATARRKGLSEPHLLT
jgi:hypothetical protein